MNLENLNLFFHFPAKFSLEFPWCPNKVDAAYRKKSTVKSGKLYGAKYYKYYKLLTPEIYF